jgi:gliding motility-associated-like protein
MKRQILVLATLLLTGTLSGMAQNASCFGLKNPIQFTLYNNVNTGQYTGMVGTKPSVASNCATGTVGLNLTQSVSNGQLATQVDNGGSSYCGSSIAPSNQFRIMSVSEGNDPLVGNNPALPMVPPGFQKSIRVGNCQISAHAEALYYTLKVVPSNALLFLNYAIVVQQPGHGLTGDPVFIIRVTKQNGSTWSQISDTLCYMVSSTPANNGGSVTIGQNGWHSTSGSGGTIYYKDWAQVAISLYKYLYQTVRVEIMIGDCSASGHYGYCYITGDCQEMSLKTNGCAAGSTEQVAEIKAPKGLNAYQWYRSKSGALTGPPRSADSSYIAIPGATDSILQVDAPMFNNYYTGAPMTQNSFKCVMTSYLNPAIPVSSSLFAEVGSMKPTLSIDSVFDCDGTVTLQDMSEVLYTDNDDDNKVDTSATQWIFYDNPFGTGDSLGTAHGGRVSFRFDSASMHSVKVRTCSFKTDGDGTRTCWNEKIIQVRSLSTPEAVIELAEDNLCYGEIATLYDRTEGSIYHSWHLTDNRGLDTTIVREGPNSERLDFEVNSTTYVELKSHNNTQHQGDTNGSGQLVTLYCDGVANLVIHVGEFPELTVTGDVVVCNGTQSIVDVSSSVPGCSIDWYEVKDGVPIQTNTTRLITTPTRDTRYYVKVTSPNGCVSWDSITIGIVTPTLQYKTKYGKPEICPGDTAILWASNAAYFDWKAVPDRDVSFVGQEHHDTIWVTPQETTTYTVVGHGSNGCSASALSQKITVKPYPVMGVETNPGYIDTENPTVQFNDVSLNRTTSHWDFGDGETAEVKTAVHRFSDLTRDSLPISLTTANDLGCSNDTLFYIPVSRFALWVPNIFTPRLESNSTFKPITTNTLEDYEFYIFDRGGTMIFSTTDQAQGWDGTYNGVECKQGSYVYLVKYRRPGIKRVKEKTGTITLVK